jgi:hypothetical protein
MWLAGLFYCWKGGQKLLLTTGCELLELAYSLEEKALFFHFHKSVLNNRCDQTTDHRSALIDWQPQSWIFHKHLRVRMSIQQWGKHGIVFALNLMGTLFLSRLRNWQDDNFCFLFSIQNLLSSAEKIQIAQQVLEQIMPLLISTISRSGNWITWISNTIPWR